MSGPRYALCLFSGAGGDTCGVRRAGYRIATCVERDRDACATLRTNGHFVLRADIAAIDWSMFDGIDLVVGGPPCQPYSVGGLGRGAADPRDGLPLFVDAVKQVQPRVFVLENVPGLGFAKHTPYLQQLLEELTGYRIDQRMLNAADFGVPQARKRLFIVGRRDGAVRWPHPSHDRLGRNGCRSWITMARALRWHRRPKGDIAWAWQRPATTVVASFHPEIVSGPGGGRGSPPRQRRPGAVRVTALQAARLQAFPRRWRFCGSASSVRRQIGNACPPPLITAVVRAQVPVEQERSTERKEVTMTHERSTATSGQQKGGRS